MLVLKNGLELFKPLFVKSVSASAVSTRRKVKTEKAPTAKKPQISKQLVEYLRLQLPSIFGPDSTLKSTKFPSKLVSIGKSTPDSIYLVDEAVANSICSKLSSENLDVSCPAIEINPGIGLLTKKLVEHFGFHHLTCFQDNNLLSLFAEQQKDWTLPPDLKVVPTNYVTFPRLCHLDRFDGGHRIYNHLNQVRIPEPQTHPGVTVESRKFPPPLYVFGALPHLAALNFLIKSYVTGTALFEEGYGWSEPIFYIVIAPRANWILRATPSTNLFRYRASSVLFQLFFKYQEIETFPRQSFIPWQRKLPVEGRRHMRCILRNDFDEQTVHFLKIEVNQETLRVLGRDNLLPFWYFVRQHLVSRRKPIIVQLESWIPGCGPRLIREGFTIYTSFGDLTPSEILKVFLTFISWPEFLYCSFLNAMDKYQAKAEAAEDEE